MPSNEKELAKDVILKILLDSSNGSSLEELIERTKYDIDLSWVVCKELEKTDL